MLLASGFVCHEPLPPLRDVLQVRGTIFPSPSHEILRLCCLPLPCLPSFSTGSLLCPMGSTVATPGTSKTPVFDFPFIVKTLGNQPLLFAQQCHWGRVFPLWGCAYFSVLHSLLPFSVSRAPFPPQHLWSDLFLPQNTSLHILTSTVWHLVSL